MSPHLPITPDQIASESIAAAEAGATILHLHARPAGWPAGFLARCIQAVPAKPRIKLCPPSVTRRQVSRQKRALLDHDRAQLAAKQAAVAVARAELDSAEWELARTIIRSPVDGTVNNLRPQIGDTVQADTPLIGIIASDSWRIIANYKQSYLPALQAGQTAWIWLDAHPWHLYSGRIVGIGRGISRQPGDGGLLPYVAPTTD